MKENRFIELLNLYVDQQLNPAEAAELEEEMQRNPARLRTYRQYCRMQKACHQLFEQERQAAPSTSRLARALADADRKVVAFPEPRSVWPQRSLYAVGIAAVGVCAALVLFRPTAGHRPEIAAEPSTRPATVVETASTAKAAPQAVAIPAADPATIELRKSFHAVLPARPFPLLKTLSTNGEPAEEKPDFAWMNSLEFAPLRPVEANMLAIETIRQSQEKDAVYIDARRPGQPLFENAAFQFQKGN